MSEYTEPQERRRKSIIEDIILKRPTMYGCTYETEEYFDYDRNYQRKRMVPNKKFFGYDPSELMTLGLTGSGWAIRRQIETIYEKGITQKCNRWDERISDPIGEFIAKVGIPGLYSVRTSNNSIGHVHANDLQEAIRVADIAFGFVVAGKKDRWGDKLELHVSFRKQGGVGDLNASNQGDVETLKGRIESAKKDIEKLGKNITRYETDLMAIQMSEISQLSATFEEEVA